MVRDNGSLILKDKGLALPEWVVRLGTALGLVRNAKGDKSLGEYDKHLGDQIKGEERIQKLKDEIGRARKKDLPDLREKLKDEIQRWKRHDKEMGDKWPDGRPDK